MMKTLSEFRSPPALRWVRCALIGVGLGSLLAYGAIYWLNRDRQGEPNSSCDKFAGPSITNGKGVAASFHTTACSTLGTSVVSYLYVHPIPQDPNDEHLVFVYSQSGLGEPAAIQWIDDNHLMVEVNHVSQVSRIRTSSGAILVGFKIHAD
jgi:hypothetical protein